MLTIVVAHSANRVIGREGDLPWHLPGDLRRFKDLTLGGTVLMGRATFESLPDAARPLPGRRNIVLSTQPGYAPEGAEVYPDWDSALAACGHEAFVIGGGEVFEHALGEADRIVATEIAEDVEGDTFFPPLAEGRWQRVAETPETAEGGHTYRIWSYRRVA